VLLVVDRQVNAEMLVDIVDQCRLAGARHVGVAVRETS
jgi:biopolymer transport protein ExbD